MNDLVFCKKSYILETDQAYINFGGWSYLFNVYCKPPLRSRADEMFGWMYPDDISQKKPDYRVILSKKALKDIKAEKIFRINRTAVYIVKNNDTSNEQGDKK